MEKGKGTGALMTNVERRSRYLIAGKLRDKKGISMTSESIKHFQKIPKKLRATLIVNNGKEFSQFKEIEIKTGLIGPPLPIHVLPGKGGPMRIPMAFSDSIFPKEQIFDRSPRKKKLRL